MVDFSVPNCMNIHLPKDLEKCTTDVIYSLRVSIIPILAGPPKGVDSVKVLRHAQ